MSDEKLHDTNFTIGNFKVLYYQPTIQAGDFVDFFNKVSLLITHSYAYIFLRGFFILNYNINDYCKLLHSFLLLPVNITKCLVSINPLYII